MSRKKWTVSKFDKEYAAEIAENYSLNPFAALLIASRGFADECELEDFLTDDPAYITDAFELPDMEKAVSRIRTAIDNFEKIVIYGDYDADGVTSTAVLYQYLVSKGADVFCYIPDRNSEGYGMHSESIQKIYEMGAKLVITVDNGISAIEEAEMIKSLGMELVVTDHHRPGDVLPDAVAVVDAYRKDYEGIFCNWAGVGVVYKLLEALDDYENDALLDEYSDLITIGTIGDVTPLVGENRHFVKSGIKNINSGKRIGLEALKNAVGMADKPINAMTVAYTLVPKINAAGRMGDASRALKLLLCEDKDEADDIAEEIIAANTLRQKTEQKIIEEARKIIENHPEYIYDQVIVIAGDGWHGGVIGIVAARLVEEYGKPCFVISNQDGIGKGSGRSIEGFSLFEALNATQSFLNHFGGHTLAAGFELETEKIDDFRRAVNEYASKNEMPVPELNIDCKINPKYINLELVDALSVLEPYGAGNKQPIFGLYKMHIDKIDPVSSGKHCRITFSRGETQLTAMKFNVSPNKLGFTCGDTVDAAVTIERNEFMGNVRVSVFIKDMRFSSMNDDLFFESMMLYEKIKRREKLESTEALKACPTRDLLARVYKIMRKFSSWQWSEETLDYRIGDNGEKMCAVLIAIDALEELGLIEKDFENGIIKLSENQDKVDLESSKILENIKSMI